MAFVVNSWELTVAAHPRPLRVSFVAVGCSRLLGGSHLLM